MPKKKIRVIKPNNLIELKSSLTPASCDVLDILLAMMDRNEGQTSFLIDTKEYEGLFSNHNGERMSQIQINERIQRGAEDLMNTAISIGSSKKGAQFNMLSSRAWNEAIDVLRINMTRECSKMLDKMRKEAASIPSIEGGSVKIRNGKYYLVIDDEEKE